ncbi:hypothetical protein E2320_022370 [Naja naja]|nr:hypothetical protein E2320_022370 [Naja naja]
MFSQAQYNPVSCFPTSHSQGRNWNRLGPFTLEYEMGEILDSRKRGKGIQYLIHWKGYPVADCSCFTNTSLTNHD